MALNLHLKKGALHKALGVKQGEKIPASKLAKASHSKSGLMRKRANFARVAKTWDHSKGGKAKGMSKGWHKSFTKAFGS